jgi:hypothetical protein
MRESKSGVWSLESGVKKNQLTWMDRMGRMKEFQISTLKSQIFNPSFVILPILSIHVELPLMKH